MKIFYIQSDIFLNNLPQQDKTALISRYSKHFKSDKRRCEHALGRHLINIVAEDFFNFQNNTVEIKNNKPYFLHNNIHFSISHSKNIVLAAFSKNNVGVDVEFMKPRDYIKILERLEKPLYFANQHDFYRIWTQYEASIKLQEEFKSMKTFKFLEDYMLSVCTNSEIKDIEIYELTADNKFSTCHEFIKVAE